MPLPFGASFARRRRARQMMRRLEQLDRLDAAYGLGAMPTERRSKRRRDWRSGVVLLACIAVFAGILITAGVRAPHNDSAPPISAGGGSYAFEEKQLNGQPVGYDPCTPIRVEINPDGEPIDTEALVRTATDHIHEASGLNFTIVGTTSSKRFLTREPSAGREPVIVGWSTADEDPELKGDVAGVGGSSMLIFNSHKQYVTGAVTLDIDAFREAIAAGQEDIAQAIVDHEFGHVVGLGHVKSRAELMYKSSTGLTTWGPGDREGLERLGNIRCR
ncbi:hypothetical protein [Nocardioides jejuensis]|uniref:Matrixin family metalloprotease n=1 Tax=Nocardioides jejuensis TaxID=2502782 RepID=A0A4V2NZU7_9ACTN|nr:hypothetical protein [Nocardioides jejuensis]TCJ30432.1 hypothetical protein EPD65_04330 [Nocardioides jejuensis]